MMNSIYVDFNGKKFELFLLDPFVINDVERLRLELESKLNDLSDDANNKNVMDCSYIMRDIINMLTDNKFNEVYGLCNRNFLNLLDFFNIMVEKVQGFDKGVINEYINK